MCVPQFQHNNTIEVVMFFHYSKRHLTVEKCSLACRIYLESGKSSWLQIQMSGFDSRCYQIFWEVVGLELDPLSLVSTIDELLGRNSSGSSLVIWEYGPRDPSHWARGTLYPQKLALSSPTSGVLSVRIVWTELEPCLALTLSVISFRKSDLIVLHPVCGAYR
jgi:hypothetical protein